KAPGTPGIRHDRQRHAERHAVLPDHDVARIMNVVAPQLLLADLDLDRLDIPALDALTRLHVYDRLHRRMASGVAGVALHRDARGEPGLSGTTGAIADIMLIPVHLHDNAIAFEHGRATGG